MGRMIFFLVRRWYARGGAGACDKTLTDDGGDGSRAVVFIEKEADSTPRSIDLVIGSYVDFS